MLDPAEKAGAPPLANLDGLLKEWSVEVGNDVVVDASGVGQMFGGDASVPVAASYPAHPITERFNLMTAFPLARSVHARGRRRQRAHAARRSSRRARRAGRRRTSRACSSGSRSTLDAAAGDKQGPIALAPPCRRRPPTSPTPTRKPGEAGDAPKPEIAHRGVRRLRLRGQQRRSASQGNRDLFLNTVNWLAQQEGLIAIRAARARGSPPHADRRPAAADPLLSIFVIPGLVFGGRRLHLVAEAIAR